MWALTLLTVLQAARANSCIRISYATDESGAMDSKSYADLLTELHGEVCTANTGAAARAAAARARWDRPVA